MNQIPRTCTSYPHQCYKYTSQVLQICLTGTANMPHRYSIKFHDKCPSQRKLDGVYKTREVPRTSKISQGNHVSRAFMTQQYCMVWHNTLMAGGYLLLLSSKCSYWHKTCDIPDTACIRISL